MKFLKNKINKTDLIVLFIYVIITYFIRLSLSLSNEKLSLFLYITSIILILFKDIICTIKFRNSKIFKNTLAYDVVFSTVTPSSVQNHIPLIYSFIIWIILTVYLLGLGIERK